MSIVINLDDKKNWFIAFQRDVADPMKKHRFRYTTVQ